MSLLTESGLINAQFHLPRVRCFYCHEETTQILWSKRGEYDFVHAVCSPYPPLLLEYGDKRPVRSKKLSDWLRALVKEE